MTRTRIALLTALAVAPLHAHAQSAIYTGRLTCGASDGGTVPAGTDAITILSRNYQGTYTHLMDSAGARLAALKDFGRGNLVGQDLTLRGGASAAGVKLQTTIMATNTGRTYDLKATQVFSGKGFTTHETRTCKGIARLAVG
jgi:hypothetical protein